MIHKLHFALCHLMSPSNCKDIRKWIRLSSSILYFCQSASLSRWISPILGLQGPDFHFTQELYCSLEAKMALSRYTCNLCLSDVKRPQYNKNLPSNFHECVAAVTKLYFCLRKMLYLGKQVGCYWTLYLCSLKMDARKLTLLSSS